MAVHNYKKQTALGTFQTLDYGDRIWPDVELENWQKVENAIMAMSTENILFVRGSFTVVRNPSDATDVTVTLSSVNTDPSFSGAINRCFFRVTEDIVWDLSLPTDGIYYLYLKAITGQIDPTSSDSLDKECTQIRYTGIDLKERILMAVLTHGTLTSIDGNPEGQLTFEGFQNHILASDDPHGSTLNQTKVVSDQIETQTIKFGEGQPFGDVVFDTTLVSGINSFVFSDFGLVGALPVFILASPLSSTTGVFYYTYSGTGGSPNGFSINSTAAEDVAVKVFLRYTFEE